jgi:FG-GAP-like repeat
MTQRLMALALVAALSPSFAVLAASPSDDSALALPIDVELGPAPRYDPFSVPPAPEFGGPKAVVPVPAITTTSKGAVKAAFNTYYNIAMPALGFTGSTATCDPGAISLAFQEWTISRINFLRAMAGVGGATALNTALNGQEQAAALYMARNSLLNHTPDPALPCWTQSVTDGAGSSNLALGTNLTDSIPLYMSDPGNGNQVLGHRRWILHSRKASFAIGEAVNGSNIANALYTFNFGLSTPATPNGITWPSRGWVPLALFPVPFTNPPEGARWSFGYPGANFASANVSMTLNGVPLTTTVITRGGPDDGYGDNTIGWSLPIGHTVVKGSVYDITVSGITGAPSAFNYQVLPFNPTDPVVEVRGDATGDGRSDLFWRDASGGLSWWQMNGPALVASNFFNVGTEWTIADVGDLNGDGKSDLVWRRTDGATYLWTLNGLAPAAFFDLGILSPAQWTLVATADLNGDGKADLVWRGADGSIYVWLMNGGVISSQGLVGNAGAGWTLREVADLDGDGKSDLIFRHTNGTVFAWFMNGLAVSSAQTVGAVDPAMWTLVGTGDFNGDGKADLLWRNTAGLYYVYFMNGAAIASQGMIGNPGLDWSVQAIGDFNGDGRADLVLRNAVTGNPHLWMMNGTTIGADGPISNPGGTWQIVAP